MNIQPMEKLRKKRIEKGWSQVELAKRSGFTNKSISHYENGLRFPRRDVLYKLADVLECEVSDII